MRLAWRLVMPRPESAALAEASSLPADASASARRTALAPLEIVARVRIADRVGRSFSPNACLLGFRYFAKQGVSVESLNDHVAVARVSGRHVHRVALRASREAGGALSGSCTCTPDGFEASPCRHQWAVILEIDRRGGFPCLRETMSAFAFAATAAPAARGADLDRSTRAEDGARPRGAAGTRARPKKSVAATSSRGGPAKARVAGPNARPERPAKSPRTARSTKASRAPKR